MEKTTGVLNMSNNTCWYRPNIIPTMAERRKAWGNLLNHPQGKVLKGLLDAAEQFSGKKPDLVADVGCGVCPLLDLVDANHYVGIDLIANVEDIRKEVPGVKIVGADMMTDNPAELAKADVVVMSAFIDTMDKPLEVLERTLTQSQGLVILHRQVVHDGPTTAKLSNSYFGLDTSFSSLINRKELYALFKKCGYGILSEVSAFANGDNWRSFMLVRPKSSRVSYAPRTWDKPENAGPARTESLKRLVPRLFEYRTALYVGASCVRFDYGEDFIKSGCHLTVLEAWKSNVECLKKISGITVVQGDVASATFPDKSFEVVMWWHGPEHVAMGDLVSTIRRLEKMSSGLVVLGCPWGINPQGDLGGNPFEEHRSYLGEHLFSELGYTVECLGEPDTYGSNIAAVKQM
jgi:hypothetical protein